MDVLWRIRQRKHSQQARHLGRGVDGLVFGLWNVGGWSQVDPENYERRQNVVNIFDCDLFAVCEMFLLGTETLSLFGYTWFGPNRNTNIRSNARRSQAA